MNRLVPVNGDTKLLVRIFQSIADLRSPLHTLHNGRYFSGNPLQLIQLSPAHLNGNTASAHGAHIHAGSIYLNLRVQSGSHFPDGVRNLFIGSFFILSGHHINRGGIGAGIPAASHHGKPGRTGHGSYILYLLNGHDCLHHLVRQLPGLVQSGIVCQLHAHCQLRGIHIRHKRGSVGVSKRNTAH